MASNTTSPKVSVMEQCITETDLRPRQRFASHESGEDNAALHGLEQPPQVVLHGGIAVPTDDQQLERKGCRHELDGHPSQEVKPFLQAQAIDVDQDDFAVRRQLAAVGTRPDGGNET
jgi:hypothetical protein